MVRLKADYGCQLDGDIRHFNSSMVRLKVRLGLDTSKMYRFQFQYGTIKRAHSQGRYLDYSYFNSSMVRLKD